MMRCNNENVDVKLIEICIKLKQNSKFLFQYLSLKILFMSIFFKIIKMRRAYNALFVIVLNL